MEKVAIFLGGVVLGAVGLFGYFAFKDPPKDKAASSDEAAK